MSDVPQNPLDDHPARANWAHVRDIERARKALDWENQIVTMNAQVEAANAQVDLRGKLVDGAYKKSKDRTYQWRSRLRKINNETKEILARIEDIVPSSMIPIAVDWDDPSKFDVENDRGNTQPAIQTIDEDEVGEGYIAQEIEAWQKSIMETQTFEEVQQLIRDQDRLNAIRIQKADILRKMDEAGGTPLQDEINELTEGLQEAQKSRDALTEQLNEMVAKRDAELMESLKEPKDTIVKVEGVQGTMYSGEVVVPPHSTVELELGKTIQTNDERIKSAKEIRLKTDALRYEKEEKQKKRQTRDAINTKVMQDIAKMLPSEMIDAFKGLPRHASPTMTHDMKKLAERNLTGKSSIECLCPPKQVGDRTVEHAKREVALRTGKELPFSFLIDVVEHWRTNIYVCQVVTNNYNLPCCLALGVDSKGQYAGKIRVRTGFFLRPDIWTNQFEAENRRIDPADPTHTIDDLIAEHEYLLSKLPNPVSVLDLLGLSNDPSNPIAVALE